MKILLKKGISVNLIYRLENGENRYTRNILKIDCDDIATTEDGRLYQL